MSGVAGDLLRKLRSHAGNLRERFGQLRRVWVWVTLVRGTLRDGGEVTVLFVGHLWNMDYLTRTAFARSEQLQIHGTFAPLLRRAMRRLAPRADVIVADLRRPYTSLLRHEGNWLEVPDWVGMEIPLADTWEGVLGNIRRNMRQEGLRIIRREGYRSETTRDAAALADFYDRMYLPFVTGRFGEETVIEPREKVLQHGREGQLLQVLRGQEVVAAGIFYPVKERLFMLWVGMPGMQDGKPADGAFSALYYFGLQLAFEGGYRVLDLAGTRGLLNDGVFVFKRKWGARVRDSFGGESILIRPCNGKPETLRFCAALPVLVRRPDRLEALVVADGVIDAERFARVEKEYGLPGLARLTLLGSGDTAGMEHLPDGPAGCEYRVVRSTADSFAADYMAAGEPPGVAAVR